MSIDYPDREVWLARRTKSKRPVRYVHVSKKIVAVPLPLPHMAVSAEPGVTYRRSRKP